MSITLSQGVPGWFVSQFDATLWHLLQQTVSKFQQAVSVKPIINAEDKRFDAIGKLTIEEKVGRNPQTPTQDVTTQGRWVDTTPFHGSVLKDKDDDLSMIIEPNSDIMTEFVNAINVQKDEIILASFDGTVTEGRRAGGSITWASQRGDVKYTGVDGNDDVTGRTIAWDTAVGNASASDTGMTIEKAELVKEYFAFNDLDENIPIWGAISPRQATNLFGQNEYVSSDFNNEKPLATGRIIRNWHGINWIVSTLIRQGTNNDADGDKNVFRCPFWTQNGTILGVKDMFSSEMSTRDDLSYSQQIYVHMNMGAMRRDEDTVCFVEAFE